ncbi:hypothetical protein BC826DRAFT_1010262 [Russula brevipes]|nr:hypothetical protein BC826DRAFT_1010262 [Russula brevipes]
MRASLVRRQFSGLVPPKIASPSTLVSPTNKKSPLSHFSFAQRSFPPTCRPQTAGKGADLSPLVAFYSKLPKGPAPEPASASALVLHSFPCVLITCICPISPISAVFSLVHLKHHKNHAH